MKSTRFIVPCKLWHGQHTYHMAYMARYSWMGKTQFITFNMSCLSHDLGAYYYVYFQPTYSKFAFVSLQKNTFSLHSIIALLMNNNKLLGIWEHQLTLMQSCKQWKIRNHEMWNQIILTTLFNNSNTSMQYTFVKRQVWKVIKKTGVYLYVTLFVSILSCLWWYVWRYF